MAKEELEDEIEYEGYADYLEDKIGKDKSGQVKFQSVDHSKRAEAFGVESDGEISTYANYALEYFGHRCALSGERLVVFDAPVKRGENQKVKTNLSAEHIVALSSGGNDIIPNIVPSVLQYNLQKNGYYILDWWPKAKDIEGNPIYSKERLLKLVNYMLKSLQIRKELGIKEKPREYRKRLLTPNAIDEYLAKEEVAQKLLSDVITATEEDIDGKKILTKIPVQEGSIPSLAEQKENELKITEEMFLIDAIDVLEREKDIPQEIIEDLKDLYKEVEGEIPFEIQVRKNILSALEEMGIEENKYTVANDLLINSGLLEHIRNIDNKEIQKLVEEYIKQQEEKLIELLPGQYLREIISYKPEVLYDFESAKEEKEIIALYRKYTYNKELDIKKLNKTYLRNALMIKKWMEDNKTNRPPKNQYMDKNGEKTVPEDEAKLGRALHKIRGFLIKPYLELETEEEKEEYKRNHPELEEVMAIVEEIDRNNIPVYLQNILEIKKWMEDNKINRPPRAQNKNKNVPEDEAKLGKALGSIREQLIKPYLELETEEEKEKYKRNHPELEEVMAIVEEIDRNNIPVYLQNILEIKKWMEDNKTNRPPRMQYKDKNGEKAIPEDEAKLGNSLSSIREQLIKPYLELETEEKEEYKRNHPELEEVMAIVEEIDRNNIPVYLQNILAIKKWMEDNKTNRPPRAQNKNKNVPEDEVKLGNALRRIRSELIKPYLELETEEEKEKYKRNHPELEEVMATVEEIDRNNIPIKENQTHYINILAIKKWMEDNKTSRPPRMPYKDKNREKTVPEDEAKLGNALHSIRIFLIKPYLELETEEEREKYKRNHPELEEVMAIVEEIDRNNIPIKEEQTYYINILAIKKWMEDNKTNRPPRMQYKDKNGEKAVPEDEAKLGSTFYSIRIFLIKPYLELEIEKEKEEYKRNHPELEEVMAIVEEIDRNNPKNKKKIKDTVKQNKGNLYETIKAGEELEAEILMVEKTSERSASDGRGQ